MWGAVSYQTEEPAASSDQRKTGTLNRKAIYNWNTAELFKGTVSKKGKSLKGEQVDVISKERAT